MHSNCVLDSVANILVRHMVFVGNVQKSPIASHLKGLDLDFCCQGPALTGIKEGRCLPIQNFQAGSVGRKFLFAPCRRKRHYFRQNSCE